MNAMVFLKSPKMGIRRARLGTDPNIYFHQSIMEIFPNKIE